MNIEQERADFEAWAIIKNYDLDAVMLLSKPPKFSRYTNPATQDAWEAYQAGRAALQSQDREDALEAENVRLREALEVVVEMVEMNGFGRDYAMDVARAALAQAPRACTCHPDDRPDGPCRERYAASECQALAAIEADRQARGGPAFAWYDPTTGLFTRNKDDPDSGIPAGSCLWPLYREAPTPHSSDSGAPNADQSPQPAEPVNGTPSQERRAKLEQDPKKKAALERARERLRAGEIRFEVEPLPIEPPTEPVAPQPAQPSTEFEDPRVQLVYGIICGGHEPPEGEHWDDYVSRLIVDALQSQDREDAARLDWLDSMNAKLNSHYGTTYRWELVLSPHVVRLMAGYGGSGHVAAIDLNNSAANGVPSCREAIDHARRIEGKTG